MSFLITTTELCGLALGASYLWFKHRQRVSSWQPREDPQKWSGHGIEISRLKPRIEHVRHDYVAARHTARGACFHRSLLELARLAVAQLGYFRRRHVEQNAREHARSGWTGR